MKKATHKLKAMKAEHIAAVIAGARSMSAAARTLGVDRSTIHRWVTGRKIPVPTRVRRWSFPASPRPGQTPESWRRALTRAIDFSVTERAVLDLAVRAYDLALTEEKPEVRLAAMGRFQALVRQLRLEDLDNATLENQETAEVRRWPRAVPGA